MASEHSPLIFKIPIATDCQTLRDIRVAQHALDNVTRLPHPYRNIQVWLWFAEQQVILEDELARRTTR